MVHTWDLPVVLFYLRGFSERQHQGVMCEQVLIMEIQPGAKPQTLSVQLPGSTKPQTVLLIASGKRSPRKNILASY